MDKFVLHSAYAPTGDQPQAIETLARGFQEGKKFQTLLGVTGSGKTFTMRIPIHAPMPMMGSIVRLSEKVLHEILSHTKIWSGTLSRFTTRKNHALMPIYSILSLRIESR